MLQAYTAYVRSILEYGLLPCIRLLHDDRLKDIEAVQRRATKTLLGIKKKFGPDVPEYSDRLCMLGLKSLSERMDTRIASFAQKIEFQEWCSEYFIQKAKNTPMDCRPTSVRPYLLPRCNTTRRQNGPIHTAISYLNGLQSTPSERKVKQSQSDRTV